MASVFFVIDRVTLNIHPHSTSIHHLHSADETVENNEFYLLTNILKYLFYAETELVKLPGGPVKHEVVHMRDQKNSDTP